MALLSPRQHSNAAQARALRTLDDILTEHGGVGLPPLRWTVEPNSSLTGHVPPLASEGEVRSLFDAWTDLLQARRLTEVDGIDRTMLRAIAPKFGLFHVYVTIQATVPDLVRESVGVG